MASAFQGCLDIETQGMNVLLPYARKYGEVLQHGSQEAQKSLGDFSIKWTASGETSDVECKIEQKYTGNLFLETWSNLSRFTTGWMFHTQADRIWYYFLDKNQLFVLNVEMLKRWAFGEKPFNEEDGNWQNGANLYDWPEVRCKRKQLNDSWGRLVPVEVLTKTGFCSLRIP